MFELKKKKTLHENEVEGRAIGSVVDPPHRFFSLTRKSVSEIEN